MSFSFEFSGDDIDAHTTNDGSLEHLQHQQPQPAGKASAFPIQGKPQLPPIEHDLKTMLSRMPSKIAYSMLDIVLDSGETIQLPRRELWDVRVQLMAEEEDDIAHLGEGLGDRDVKTGVYEGGFKSWESSVDLVKALATQSHLASYLNSSVRVIELGCGTGLPSLAMFQWAMSLQSSSSKQQYSFYLADYNPSVLHLVTLPNFILTWALYHRQSLTELQDAFSLEGELELTPSILEGFETYLRTHGMSLLFLSGGWSAEFVQLLYSTSSHLAAALPELSSVSILLGAETIYSPFALQAFTEAVLAILERERVVFGSQASAWVAAKRLYFGVGGSLDDFVDKIQKGGTMVTAMREETDGVRRGVVRCVLAPVE
ncbi:hypothetical protein J3458_014590 [Metarhizium acridum]|uniref:protein-histidine N-methyltransferase n=1 Tax=Metarhizium acridum (strain CQMa 102) TaxID=655827 RepID=E9E3Y8_METAQ|nr:uncharacterized protein MAC_04586 [Metarhizium acridum CQMa 102]EFY89400.1 hypothetical protein MAC_04586 [Metarhizium acridum CQMa 102]KAG8412413.1 hypothetical protein J3458_014590 [Metarhizium acridum]